MIVIYEVRSSFNININIISSLNLLPIIYLDLLHTTLILNEEFNILCVIILNRSYAMIVVVILNYTTI